MTEQSSSEAPPLSFDFLPNQIELLVRHTLELSPTHFEALTQALSTQIGRNLRQRGEALTFRAGGQPAFSILPIEAGLPADEAQTIQPVIASLNGLSSEDLTGLLQNSDFPTQAVEGQAQPLVAEPNWFTLSSNHGQGTGGTGSWPLPADPSLPVLVLSQQTVPQITAKTNAAVTLAFLDTHLISGGHAQVDPAILSRLTFDSDLPITAAAHLALAGHHVNGHPYLMTSHGLFAAFQALRLIDRLAVANPSVVIPSNINVIIYEALDHFGVGEVHHIYTILQRLSQTPQPLVINLSLVLHAPAGGAANLQTICDLLESQGAVIVAAAGNEAQRSYNAGLGRPEPMQPAAFGSVIGVSALALNQAGALNSAPYSNLSDTLNTSQTQRTGFAAIGGGSNALNPTTQIYEASTNEVSGPFVDVFPGGQTNPHHWAFWSGTSFAAPRISALAAVLLSTGAYAVNPSASTRANIEAEILSNYRFSFTTDNEPTVEL